MSKRWAPRTRLNVRVNGSTGKEVLPLEVHLLESESEWWNTAPDALLSDLLTLIGLHLPILSEDPSLTHGSSSKKAKDKPRKVLGDTLQFTYEMKETRPVTTLLCLSNHTPQGSLEKLQLLPFTLAVWPAALDSLSLDVSFNDRAPSTISAYFPKLPSSSSSAAPSSPSAKRPRTDTNSEDDDLAKAIELSNQEAIKQKKKRAMQQANPPPR